nr:formin-like protein 4 [Ipomoea batatas]
MAATFSSSMNLHSHSFLSFLIILSAIPLSFSQPQNIQNFYPFALPPLRPPSPPPPPLFSPQSKPSDRLLRRPWLRRHCTASSANFKCSAAAATNSSTIVCSVPWSATTPTEARILIRPKDTRKNNERDHNDISPHFATLELNFKGFHKHITLKRGTLVYLAKHERGELIYREPVAYPTVELALTASGMVLPFENQKVTLLAAASASGG